MNLWKYVKFVWKNGAKKVIHDHGWASVVDRRDSRTQLCTPFKELLPQLRNCFVQGLALARAGCGQSVGRGHLQRPGPSSQLGTAPEFILSSELPMNSAAAFIESSSSPASPSAQPSYACFFSTGVDQKAPPTASCTLIPSEPVSPETQPGFVHINGRILAAFTSWCTVWGLRHSQPTSSYPVWVVLRTTSSHNS